MLIYGDCVAKLWHCLRFLSFLKRRVSSYLLNLQDNSSVAGLLLSRRVSSYPHPELHLFAIPENSTLRLDCMSFSSRFPVLDQSVRQGAVSIRGLFDATGFCSRRTCQDSEGQVHRRRLWLCHGPLFSFLFLHPFRHRFSAAGQAESLRAATWAELATVQPMEKIVPLITCEIPLCQCLRVGSWCQCIWFGSRCPD